MMSLAPEGLNPVPGPDGVVHETLSLPQAAPALRPIYHPPQKTGEGAATGAAAADPDAATIAAISNIGRMLNAIASFATAGRGGENSNRWLECLWHRRHSATTMQRGFAAHGRGPSRRVGSSRTSAAARRR